MFTKCLRRAGKEDTNGFLVSKETVVLRRRERSKQKLLVLSTRLIKPKIFAKEDTKSDFAKYQTKTTRFDIDSSKTVVC